MAGREGGWLTVILDNVIVDFFVGNVGEDGFHHGAC